MAGQRSTEEEILAVEREMAGELGPGELRIDIPRCARCLTEHDQLLFKQLGHPIELPYQPPVTHWSLCPSNGQPILMVVGQS